MASTLDETLTVYCISDFKLSMPKVSGRTALMHALARRLQTPRGRFPRWKNYGTDIRSMLLSKIAPYQIVSAAVRECEKDERVAEGGASAVATVLDGGRSLRLDLTITDAEGPFTFTMSVDEAALSLIELQKEAS